MNAAPSSRSPAIRAIRKPAAASAVTFSLPPRYPVEPIFLLPLSRADDRTSIRVSFAPQHKERPSMRHGVVKSRCASVTPPLVSSPKRGDPFREAEVLGAIGRGGKASSSLVECSLDLELSRPPVVYRESPEKSHGTALWPK